MSEAIPAQSVKQPGGVMPTQPVKEIVVGLGSCGIAAAGQSGTEFELDLGRAPVLGSPDLDAGGVALAQALGRTDVVLDP